MFQSSLVKWLKAASVFGVVSVGLFGMMQTAWTPAAVAAVDAQAPSVPQGVTAVAVPYTEIKVSWKASTDNTGVAGYKVYQDGKLVVTTKNLNTSYMVTGLVPPTKHAYAVSAYDAAGNASALSVGATAAIAAAVPQSTSDAYDKIVLADHPVALWDMNPKSGTEPDMSGYGNTGTYKNGVPSSATMPNGDHAADFNGTNQYLTVPDSASFSIPTTGSLTWEAWIRPDTLQFPESSGDGYADFMGKCATYSPNCEWEARMYDSTTAQAGRSDRISAYAFNATAGFGSAADWQPSSGLINAGQWIHVVGEYTTRSQPQDCANTSAYPGSVTIWVNGVEWNQSEHAPTGCMSQYDVTPKAGTSPLNIGTMALDYWFKGAIGKVAIYNYALSQAQINAHYKAMTGSAPLGSCGTTCNF